MEFGPILLKMLQKCLKIYNTLLNQKRFSIKRFFSTKIIIIVFKTQLLTYSFNILHLIDLFTSLRLFARLELEYGLIHPVILKVDKNARCHYWMWN